MHITVSDSYDTVSVFSVYWESDNTDGADDSSLFIQTLSKLQNVQTCQQSLSDDETLLGSLGLNIIRAVSQSRTHKLFIFHYAGHTITGSTLDSPQTGSGAGQWARDEYVSY